jgi:hypothetical protein
VNESIRTSLEAAKRLADEKAVYAKLVIGVGFWKS